jgi:hypothetical protein
VRTLLIAAVLICSVAQANPYREKISVATDLLDDAIDLVQDGSGCEKRNRLLNELVDDVHQLRRDPSRLAATQEGVRNLQRFGPACSSRQLGRLVEKAGDALDQARRLSPMPQAIAVGITFAPLRVQPNVPGPDGAMGVEISAPHVTLRGLRVKNIYFASRVKSFRSSAATEWNDGPPAMVQQDAVNVPNPYRTIVRLSSLPPGRRHVAVVAAFDNDGNLLGEIEAPFETRWDGPEAQSTRECGTEPDSGCAMQRKGQWAMDKETFDGLMSALKANPSEYMRKEMLTAVLAGNFVTAKQLGLILDVFASDYVRYEVVKAAAPITVDPSHALILAKKFTSGWYQTQLTQLMAGQK